MAFFKRKQSWERTFRLRSRKGSGRWSLVAIFWVWGVCGLVINVNALFGLTGFVVAAANLTAACLVWIGGMVLFGLGGVLSHSDFDGERPVSDSYGDVRVTE